MFVTNKLIKALAGKTARVYFSSVFSTTASCHKMDGIKTDLRNVFMQSVKSVSPNVLVRNAMVLEGGVLKVNGVSYDVDGNCLLVGFGKAVLGMAAEAERILGSHLVTGVVSVPEGILEVLRDKEDMLPVPGSVLEILEGARHNLPDASSERAARKVKELAVSVDQGSILVVLVSGGGSALLPLPRPPVTLQDKCSAITLLATAGADITELNCVRKRLSLLKGGGLAQAAYPAHVVTLVLSDIVGDPLDFIASGPTVANSDPPSAALNIVHKYNLTDKMPLTVISCLSETTKGLETNNFDHVQNVIIGNNTIAVESAREEASRCGYVPVILSTRIQGLVRNVGEMYAELAGEICKCASGYANNLSGLLSSFGVKYEFFRDVEKDVMCGVKKLGSGEGLCLVAGGETTVVVQGRGLGGRNQELALQFAVCMHNLEQVNPCIAEYDVALLSCGTDGIDGPTNAAGAIGYSSQCCDENLLPSRFLSDNDSHNFYRTYKGGSDLVTVGHTGTNVMDVHILVIKKKLKLVR